MSDMQDRLVVECRNMGFRVYARANEDFYPGAVILAHGLDNRALRPLEAKGYRLAPSGRDHVIVTAPDGQSL